MKHPLILLVALAVLIGLGWIALRGFGGDGAAPIDAPVASNPDGDASAGLRRAAGDDAARSVAVDAGARVAVAPVDATVEDLHPSVRAALCGFTGRLVTPEAAPVANAKVELFRIAPDVLFLPGVGPFVGEQVGEPKIDAGETVSGDDGRFTIEGVYPHSTYLLLADGEGDSPTWRPIERAAGPGELVDLGDVVVEPCGILTGLVVGPDDRPVAGALVRAVDLPGSVLAFVPFERFDPRGAIFVTEGTKMVVAMPPWVESRVEKLPIAQTRTGSDGRFRLRGVVPGGNLFAVNARELLPHVKPRVVVRSGEEKDLGTVRMSEGELAVGRVEDDQGKPIAGAEVLVATRSTAAPLHFASYAQATDDEGKFTMAGMPPGDVVVAARRARGDPWTFADPQPVARDVLIRLPSILTLTLRILDGENRAVADPRVQLLPGEDDEAAIGMSMWGFNTPVPLAGKTSRGEHGELVVTGLQRGAYVVLADSPKHATGSMELKLDADRTVDLVLAPKAGFDVKVERPDGAPAAGAEVFAHARGSNAIPDAPVHAGRVADDGTLRVDCVSGNEVALSARHPAFGMCHLRTTLPAAAPVVLRFGEPASIMGTVSEGGSPPARGKYMVYAIDWRGGNRGALPPMPQITAVDGEGKFRYRALAPGEYRVGLVSTLGAIRSPGGMVGYVRDAMFATDLPAEQVELAAGASTEVLLDTLASERIEGPTVRLTGTVTVDGLLAKDHLVTVWGENTHQRRTLDAAGRFEFAQVPVGSLTVQIQEPPPEDLFAPRARSLEIWRSTVRTEAGKDLDLPIEVGTGSLDGVVLGTDGAFAAEADVNANGAIKSKDGNRTDWISRHERSDQNGRFRFAKLPAGEWTITATKRQVGRSTQVKATLAVGAAETGLQITLAATHVLRGTIDLSAFGEPQPKDIYLWMTDVNGQGLSGWAKTEAEGAFTMSDVADARYRVQINLRRPNDQWEQWHGVDEIEMLGRDVEGFRIRPLKEQPEETRRR
ncbi:MAG: carboxypeptidase regulatory-like domain-containing protein [Planctomycetes bacterium]|nr:carboxypeptidase regulatory-like domain-containing protein [Planctomycetota bacterium]